MRARGLPAETIFSLLQVTNHQLCVPPLEDADVRRMANDIGRKPAGFPGQRQIETSDEIDLQYYHNIERDRVKWLWPGRIPAGKLTLFVGDPGTGKSLVTLDLAARLSTGRPFPDGHPCEKGNVLILTAEDDARDTVGPRLDAAGADSSRIARINAVRVTLSDGTAGESAFSLERDLAKLEDSLAKNGSFKLVIVDPLTAHLGKVNSWRDAEVRGILTPITDFASRTGIAVGGIMHMRKSETDAMLRVSGSIAFVAAARAVWGFGVDPDDETQRVMVGVKCNLAALGNAMAYKISSNNADGAPHIVWQKELRTLDANEVLGMNAKEKRERAHRRGEAEEWLRAQLADGARPQKQLEADAEGARISPRTLRRARKSLGVKPHKAGMAGGWYWELPEVGQQGGQNDSI
jgi:hypothetical protein